MRFIIARTSIDVAGQNPSKKPCDCAEWYPALESWMIEINDLGDIRSLMQDTGHPIIIDGDTLEIYDSLRE